MSELGGLQNGGSAGVGQQLQATQVGACPTFTFVGTYNGGVLAHSTPQSSIATRSYSDLGPYRSIPKGTIQRIQAAEALEAGNPQHADGSKNMSAMDMVFYHQYNSLYGVTEVEAGGATGYYPCSNGLPPEAGLRGGPGSWSFRLDPEVRRKGRLASYRAISFEGKMRSSMKKSFKWFKHKCISLLPGHAARSSPPSSHAGIPPV